MKRSKVVQLVAMGSTAAVLSGCDQPVNPYVSIQDCIEKGIHTEAFCRQQFEEEQDDYDSSGSSYYYGGGGRYSHKPGSYSSKTGLNDYKTAQQRSAPVSNGGFGGKSFGFSFGS